MSYHGMEVEEDNEYRPNFLCRSRMCLISYKPLFSLFYLFIFFPLKQKVFLSKQKLFTHLFITIMQNIF